MSVRHLLQNSPGLDSCPKGSCLLLLNRKRCCTIQASVRLRRGWPSIGLGACRSYEALGLPPFTATCAAMHWSGLQCAVAQCAVVHWSEVQYGAVQRGGAAWQGAVCSSVACCATVVHAVWCVRRSAAWCGMVLQCGAVRCGAMLCWVVRTWMHADKLGTSVAHACRCTVGPHAYPHIHGHAGVHTSSHEATPCQVTRSPKAQF